MATYTLGNITASPWTYTTAATNWSTVDYTSSASAVMTTTPAGTIELKGEKADVVINGVSLNQTLSAINQRLGVLVPNPELELMFDELKDLSDRYKELETKLLEQKKVFDILKDNK